MVEKAVDVVETPVWCAILCTECSKASDGHFTFNSSVQMRELKKRALARGWTFFADKAFCSKTCMTTYLNRE